MKKNLLLLAIFGISLMPIFFIVHQRPNKPYVVCTTTMIADAARSIAGEYCQVDALMGPGVDPHLYRAKAGDMHMLAAADLVLYNGLHLEGKLSTVFARMVSKRVIAVTDCLDRADLLIPDGEQLHDPHVWHDVVLWRQVVQYIAECIQSLDSSHHDDYRKHLSAYLAQFDALEQFLRDALNQLPVQHRTIVTAHDAFNYFGKRYGFEVEGLQGMSTESDISLRDVAQLAQLIVHKKIPAIFLESSIAHRSILALRNAVEAQGWPLILGDELYSDALGDEASGAATYVGMMRHNITALVSALQ